MGQIWWVRSFSKLGNSLGWTHSRASLGGGVARARRARHQSPSPRLSTHGRLVTTGLGIGVALTSRTMALDAALDIGTSNTRLATTERGIIFNEPTMVAIDTNSGRVVEVGHGALDMVARTPRHVVVFRPFNQGATVDFDVTARLIAGLFERAGVSKMSRARVVMSVPSLATAIERRALRQAAIQAGAREASLIEAPLAAAIGLGMPIQDPVGSAVVLLGGGASEAAVVSLGGIVTGAARRIGGSDVDAAIATALRLHLGVVVAPSVLEML